MNVFQFYLPQKSVNLFNCCCTQTFRVLHTWSSGLSVCFVLNCNTTTIIFHKKLCTKFYLNSLYRPRIMDFEQNRKYLTGHFGSWCALCDRPYKLLWTTDLKEILIHDQQRFEAWQWQSKTQLVVPSQRYLQVKT